MTLSVGSSLGPYEILAGAGAGGMGEVYRARDTRLGRTVALKVLPESLAEHPELRERFHREAQALSQLTHPHICTLHDIGEKDGTTFLVMEYLEGETLADRLAKGALPLDALLRIAVEIAEALDAAHRHGVIHRDLKPGNIMLTKAGTKLIDFGLVKEDRPPAARGTPTVSAGPDPLTEAGTIVGTYPYMAPEQLEGKPVDARTDIFAYGAVLYEMATGRRAFEGDSAASLIAAVLAIEPSPISALRPLTPPALEAVVKTCLAKDPDERWQSARDAARPLRWLAAGAETPSATVSRTRERWAWAVAGLGVIAALILAVTTFLSTDHDDRAVKGVVRFPVRPPDGVRIRGGVEEHNVALSPDGTTLVFLAGDEDRHQLWTRKLSDASCEPLAGTEGARSPFFKPDGQYIGFTVHGKLKKMRASGGIPKTICEIQGRVAASWGRRGEIIFTEFMGRRGVLRVSEEGGEPRPMFETIPCRWPHFLPDGEHFLFMAWPDEEAFIAAASLDSPALTTVVPVRSRVRYASPGFLLYVAERQLVAHPFDLIRLRTFGESTPLAEVSYFRNGWSPFASSGNGVLVYLPDRGPRFGSLDWLDRRGQKVGTVGEPGYFGSALRLSREGDKLVVRRFVDVRSREPDIFLYDLEQGGVGEARFTSVKGTERSFCWSPDGERIAFTRGLNRVLVKDTAGSVDERTLFHQSGFLHLCDWSPTDDSILYERDAPESRGLWTVRPGEEPEPFLLTEFDIVNGVFSPDGRWVAYQSDETGRDEIWVRSFDDPNQAPVRISRGGGVYPRWRGDEIFYIADAGLLMAAPVKCGPPFERVGEPQPLFDMKGEHYDVSHDGKRILMVSRAGEAEPMHYTVVLNWMAELER